MIALIRKILRRRPRVDPAKTLSYVEMTKDTIKIGPETIARYAKFKMEQMG